MDDVIIDGDKGMNDNMFEPRFAANPIISQNLEDIKRSSWLVERVLIMPQQQDWIRRNVSIERAVGTTTIEGAVMSEEQVKELEKRRPRRTTSENERENLNALRAYEFIDYLSDQPDIPINELVIRELNRQFMHGASEVLTPGVYRKGQNRVGSYMPPDQGDVPVLMRAFSQWLEQDDETQPVVKAGIAHIHLAAIHPFWDGNGRVARALATLILQRSPFHFRKLLSLEKFMATPAVQQQYRAAIEETLGSQFSREYNATPWLAFFTTALNMHSRHLEQKLADWHRMIEEIYGSMAELGVTYRQTEGLTYAYHMGRMTRGDYIEITGVSPETASRDLARLVAKGLLIAKGNTRSRVYLKPEPKREPTDMSPQQLPLPE
jgi:Fic family protein